MSSQCCKPKYIRVSISVGIIKQGNRNHDIFNRH